MRGGCSEATESVRMLRRPPEVQARDAVPDREQGCETLAAQVGEEEYQANQCEEREHIGFDILTVGEVVERAVALGPRDNGDEDSDEKQKDAAQQKKLPGEPV